MIKLPGAILFAVVCMSELENEIKGLLALGLSADKAAEAVIARYHALGTGRLGLQFTPQKTMRDSALMNITSKDEEGVVLTPKQALVAKIQYKLSRCNRTGCGTSIFVNNSKISSGDDFYSAVSAPELMDLSMIYNVALQEQMCSNLSKTDLDKYGVHFDPSALHLLGESKYQEKYDDDNKKSKYLAFTSGANQRTPAFKPHSNYFSATGKCDNMSKVRNISIEFKSGAHELPRDADSHAKPLTARDQEVLFQSISRVFCDATVHHQYRTSGVFAISNNHCWLVWLKRTWDGTHEYRTTELTEELRVMHMRLDEYPSVWAALTKEAVECPSVLYSAQSPLMYRFLRHFTLDVGFLRVVTIGASKSVVMGITFPQWCHEAKAVVVDPEVQHFAIKVIATDEEYKRELAGIKHMAAYYKNCDEDLANEFYAVGFQGASDCQPTFFTRLWRDFAAHIKTELDQLSKKHFPSHSVSKRVIVPWWRSSPDDPTQGGIIIMRCAHYKISRETMSEVRGHVMNGVHRSLYHMHNANLVHRDVRIRNVMHFGSVKCVFHQQWDSRRPEPIDLNAGWALVDYGMAGIPCSHPSIAGAVARTKACASAIAAAMDCVHEQQLWVTDDENEDEDENEQYDENVVEAKDLSDEEEDENLNRLVASLSTAGANLSDSDHEPEHQSADPDHSVGDISACQQSSDGDSHGTSTETWAPVVSLRMVQHNAFKVAEGPLQIHKESGLYIGAGVRVKETGSPQKKNRRRLRDPALFVTTDLASDLVVPTAKKFEYFWSFGDDYEMAMEMYQQLELQNSGVK